MTRALRCAGCALLLLLWHGRARADDAELLHEYVPELQSTEATEALGRSDRTGASVVYDGQVLSSPDEAAVQASPAFSATPGDGRAGELPGQRSPSFRPDRLTELEGTLDYYEAFNPAIAPFKRVTTLDAIKLDADGVTPVLVVSDSRRRELRVENPDTHAPDARPRDRFWGDVLLDFSAGRTVPLPSVSPHSRILGVQTTPEAEVRIQRDAADNYFVQLVSPAPAGPVRMVFLTDAPRAYFGATVPHLPLGSLASELPPLEPSIARRGRGFAAELGITPKSDLHFALHTLTRYFRQWHESATPPADTGDIYLDLARGQKGVCRHRAYAFVVTAQALGLPARFVQNEAHSWVEVKLPQLGFMRIDLGGAAHGLQAHGASDRPVYTPAEPDSLPRPDAYRESYSTLDHGVTGLRPKEADVMGRWVSPSESSDGHAAAPAVFMSGPNASGARDHSARKPLVILLKDRTTAVLRGGKLSLTGRLTDSAGQGVPELRVEISLAAKTRKDRMLLGVTVTDEAGYFRASLGIPPDLSVGDYRLVVLSPGNERFLPVVAQ
ncbi:MAG TPA: transglutaminase domain-containing protein [Polyangiales bacterium]